MHKEWSLKLVKLIRSVGKECMENECFDNACKAVIAMAQARWSQELQSTLYVEGWVITVGIPQEHAWLEIRGEVVDPTLSLHFEMFKDAQYFPGNRYTPEQLSAKIDCRKKACPDLNPLPLYFFNDDCTPADCRGGEFMGAYEKAWQYIKENSNASSREVH